MRFAAHTKRPVSNALVAALSAATNHINPSTLAGTKAFGPFAQLPTVLSSKLDPAE